MGEIYYGIEVANVLVTSENCNNITGDRITGSVSYNDESKTLILDNATIKGSIKFLDYEGDIIISLVGKNVCYALHTVYDGTKTINGTGSLKANFIACDFEQNTIIEDCTIEIVATDENNWAMLSFDDGSKLTIKNANLSVEAGLVAIGDFASIELVGCEIVEPINAQIIDKEFDGDYASEYVCDADSHIAKKVVIKSVKNKK